MKRYRVFLHTVIARQVELPRIATKPAMIHDVEQGAMMGTNQHAREHMNPMPIGDPKLNLILRYTFWAVTRSASEFETTRIDSQLKH